ncbi:MAG: PrgI family protein [Oscillospiraceae bacterium]|nr:PrgI family protein [Oscillospiraceae bacterium]
MGEMKRTIPAEIKAFKEKFFFGLTLRQLVCGAGIIALAVPTGIIGSRFFSQDTIGWIIVVEVAPLAAIGWASYNDMPIEKIGKKALQYYFGVQKRKFKYFSKEAYIHDQIVNLDLDAVTAERSEELKAENDMKKEQRRLQKALKKKNKHSRKKEDESI